MNQKTVLLVEDHYDSREIYGSILRHAGYRVLEGTSGRDAIRLAERQHPDLIVMDLGLPIVDGWQATEQLKRHPSTAQIPVVAITVHVQDFYRARAQVVGCNSFLYKPCSPKDLLREVGRLLSV